MILQLKIALIALAAFAIFGAGWEVERWHIGASQTTQEAKALEGRVTEESAVAKIDTAAVATVAKDETKADTIIAKETTNVAKNAAYDCHVPADGLQSIRDLVTARTPTR